MIIIEFFIKTVAGILLGLILLSIFPKNKPITKRNSIDITDQHKKKEITDCIFIGCSVGFAIVIQILSLILCVDFANWFYDSSFFVKILIIIFTGYFTLGILFDTITGFLSLFFSLLCAVIVLLKTKNITIIFFVTISFTATYVILTNILLQIARNLYFWDIYDALKIVTFFRF